MSGEGIDGARVEAILSYMIEHGEGHGKENEKWLRAVEAFGNEQVTRELRKVVELSHSTVEHLRRAREALHGEEGSAEKHEHVHEQVVSHHHIQYHQIGTIHTPYEAGTPYSEMKVRETPCRIVLDDRFVKGLWKMDSFSHLLVLFHLDKISDEQPMTVSPSWAQGVKTGLFASRSPVRPNPIGLSVVRIREIRDNVIHTENIDAYDGTPLLDIKPYLEAVDSRVGAGNGWIDDLDDAIKPRDFS